MAIVYTGGTFDLFHAGHVNFLWQCAKIAASSGRVIVSLNTDSFVTKYKGVAPIYTYLERETLLKGCKYVSEVIPNEGGRDSKPSIMKVKPNFIAIGSDWACKDYYKQMGFTQKWLDNWHITLIYIPYTEGISTTVLKQRIMNA